MQLNYLHHGSGVHGIDEFNTGVRCCSLSFLHTFWFCFPLDDHVALRAFNANFSSIFLTRDLSPVWADFNEVNEIADGIQRVIAICKFSKARLSANSAHGTGHLLRHQKSCRKKADYATMVQTRLALNPDGSYRN